MIPFPFQTGGLGFVMPLGNDGGRWNPADKDPALDLSNGDRTITKNTGTNNSRAVRGTMGRSTGIHSYEVTLGTVNAPIIGIATITPTISGVSYGPGIDTESYGYYGPTGQQYRNNILSAYGASYTTGNVIRTEVDFGALTLTYYKNGVSQGPIAIVAGTYYPCMSLATSGNVATADFSLW